MSYTINNYDGTLLTTINDGTKDTTTSLTLAGPNFVGYGQYLNENLVYLLENFAGNTAPAGINLQGQLWFNKSTQALEVFTTSGYVPVSGVILQATQPVQAVAGNTWFDTAHNQYYMYDGTNWNLIGPVYTKQQGLSGAIPVAVGDKNNIGLTHDILQLQYGNVIIATVSSDPTFTPSTTIAGFPVINPGITLNNSIASPVTTTNVVGSLTGNVTGNVTGNLTGNVTGTVLTASQPNITSLGTISNLAIVGTATLNGLQIATVGAGGSASFSSINNTPVGNATPSTGAFTTATVGALLPTGNATVNIGSNTAWFNKIYGVSTQAQYADLAENYLADTEYAPGTVLMFGGSAEVTQADAETTKIAGVVSTNPAHLMNGALTGANVVALALIGRVPCRVLGPVNRGDLLVSAGNGYAKTSKNPKYGQVIGRAIGQTVDNGIIEIVVGRLC